MSATKVRPDLVYETPNDGAVFSVGSIAYSGALPWNGFDNNISHLTSNVLKRFMDPAPSCCRKGNSSVATQAR
ncbi:hypothetical protein [Bradyrhizobium elkanii]|uniref:hypothetical protein n=1 Tax=Bradyrhizobium elkanii TaxID=29448 RepID=UPI001FEE4587|nr:hypothetical protein [Bradyrhizobium elkanii]